MTEKSDLSDNSNSSNIKRNIFSDEPSKKIELNKNTNKNLSFQIDNIPNPIDYSNKWMMIFYSKSTLFNI